MESINANLIHSNFHGEYVALSFGLGFVGAYVGVHLSEQFRLHHKANHGRKLSFHMYRILVLMACSIGGVAVWAMHFVGMSAVSFTDPDGNAMVLRYRYDYTIISLIVILVLCFAGIYLCAIDPAYIIDKNDTIDNFIANAEKMSIQDIRKNKTSAIQVIVRALTKNILTLVLGGVMMGTGVCVMHFLGMQAVILDADIHWNAGIIAAAAIIAAVASTAAYWILFRFLALYPHIEVFRFASAAIAAVAVNGMHYTGMAAATYVYNPGKAALTSQDKSMYSGDATIGAIIASVLFLFGLVLFVVVDLRNWYNLSAKLNRTADSMMKILEKEQIQIPAVKKVLATYLRLRGEDLEAEDIELDSLITSQVGSSKGGGNRRESRSREPSASLNLSSLPPTQRKPSGAHVLSIDQLGLGLSNMENGERGDHAENTAGNPYRSNDNTARSSFNGESTSGKNTKNAPSTNASFKTRLNTIPSMDDLAAAVMASVAGGTASVHVTDGSTNGLLEEKKE